MACKVMEWDPYQTEKLSQECSDKEFPTGEDCWQTVTFHYYLSTFLFKQKPCHGCGSRQVFQSCPASTCQDCSPVAVEKGLLCPGFHDPFRAHEVLEISQSGGIPLTNENVTLPISRHSVYFFMGGSYLLLMGIS